MEHHVARTLNARRNYKRHYTKHLYEMLKEAGWVWGVMEEIPWTGARIGQQGGGKTVHKEKVIRPTMRTVRNLASA